MSEHLRAKLDNMFTRRAYFQNLAYEDGEYKTLDYFTTSIGDSDNRIIRFFVHEQDAQVHVSVEVIDVSGS